jgi:hypothetical protein
VYNEYKGRLVLKYKDNVDIDHDLVQCGDPGEPGRTFPTGEYKNSSWRVGGLGFPSPFSP